MTDASFPSLLVIRPVMTSFLGLLGVGGGIYDFISPYEGIKGFGLQQPSDSSAMTGHTKAFQRALMQVHGIRNIGAGLSTLSLVLFWQFSPLCRASPAAELVARRCLGITLTLGTVVGLGDAWILKQFGGSDGVEGAAKEAAMGKSFGHGITALIIAGLGLSYLII